jgi:hypothetical protein
MKHLTRGDQWKEGHAVIETNVFDRMYIFSPDRRRECEGSQPTLCRSTAFS